MPKVKTMINPDQTLFDRLTYQRIVVKRLSMEELATRAGMKVSTVYKRFAQPGTVRLYELRALCKVLGMNIYLAE
jgi:DNA-binding phage protein